MIRKAPLLALASKELKAWFYSPLFYGTGIFFVLFLSIRLFYLQSFFAMDNASLRPFFSSFPLLYILVIPVITMKSWAEEKKLGTAELLLTMPLTEWELSIGKFLASFFILLLYLLLSLPVPLSLLPLARFDMGVMITEYAGTVLLGASAISLGIFLSNLSKNQAAAFLSCVSILLLFMFIHRLNDRLTVMGNFWFLRHFINYISLSFHFESFSRGLLDSRDLAFFIITTLLFLFLNTKLLLFRKWS